MNKALRSDVRSCRLAHSSSQGFLSQILGVRDLGRLARLLVELHESHRFRCKISDITFLQEVINFRNFGLISRERRVDVVPDELFRER